MYRYRSMILACALVLPVTGVLPGPARSDDSPVGNGIAGQAIYEGTCIACHGSNGKGVIPGVPDLTARDGPLAKPHAVLVDHIENGFQRPGSLLAMPPNGGNPDLTRADIEDVLTYMDGAF